MLNPKDVILKIPEVYKKDLDFISKQIKESGHESFIIGGAVRDLLRGQEPYEYDITTSMHPEEVKKKFKRVIETGIQHGTVTVMLGENAYEITTYRKDVDYTDGRRPDRIEFGTSLSEDMKRRDFTMNAIALDILSEKIIDENNGFQDIENKIIRTIDNPLERFGEDGLRPIRAIRFQATLGFRIEPETYKAIYITREITRKISRERFNDELNKILASKNPCLGLMELYKNQIFELFTNVALSEKQNLNELENINKLDSSPLGLRLAYLLSWLTRANDKSTSAGQILKDFRYSRQNSKDCLFYLDLFGQDSNIENLTLVDTRKLLSKIISYTHKREKEQILNGFLSYVKSFSDPDSFIVFENQLIKILESNEPLVLKELVVNGNSILEKFPELEKRKLGSLLHSILIQVLENPKLNNEESIFRFIQEIKLNE